MKIRACSIALTFSAAMLASSALTSGALAQALQTYVLENIRTQSADKQADVLIPRIEMTGTNVSRADLERLLTPDLSTAARAEIMTNMQAQRILVPQVIVTRTGKDSGRFELRDYLVVNLDRARFDRISLGGVKGTVRAKDNPEATFTSGQITLEGGDFTKVAAAAKAGNAADGVAKLRLFSWSGFELTVPDDKTPASAPGGNMFRFGMKSASAKTDYSGDIPTKAVANFDGMYFVAPPSSQAGSMLSSFGYNRIEFGLNFDGSYNPANRTFALTNYSLTGLNAGSLAFSGGFADVDGAAFTSTMVGRLDAMMKGKISDFNLRYVDAGLFEKALVFYAQTQGKSAAAVRKEWSMMIVGMLPMVMGGDPAALKISEALSAFVNQPKSLSISLKGKNGPVAISDLSALSNPMTLLSLVEITAVANK